MCFSGWHANTFPRHSSRVPTVSCNINTLEASADRLWRPGLNAKDKRAHFFVFFTPGLLTKSTTTKTSQCVHLQMTNLLALVVHLQRKLANDQFIQELTFCQSRRVVIVMNAHQLVMNVLLFAMKTSRVFSSDITRKLGQNNEWSAVS